MLSTFTVTHPKTGEEATGRIAGRRPKKGLLFLLWDQNPKLDGWYPENLLGLSESRTDVDS